MGSWPSAVLFDFDGVLVNSEPLHLMAFEEILRAEKIELGEEEYYRDLIGFDDRGAIEHVYRTRGLTLEPKTLLKLLTRKGEATMELIHRRQYQALEGVEEFVRGLWRHYPLAICSGARRQEVEAMLEGIKLRDCFPTIVAAEDVHVGKPDPEGYLRAAQAIARRNQLELEAADCLIVEDAPAVIAPARRAGFVVLAVANSYPAEKLAAANFVVRSLHPAQVLKQIPQLKLAV
jgi:HAD superfamily hydrolase (TIGR01509 family)